MAIPSSDKDGKIMIFEPDHTTRRVSPQEFESERAVRQITTSPALNAERDQA